MSAVVILSMTTSRFSLDIPLTKSAMGVAAI
jgi:hypothetical protein